MGYLASERRHVRDVRNVASSPGGRGQAERARAKLRQQVELLSSHPRPSADSRSVSLPTLSTRSHSVTHTHTRTHSKPASLSAGGELGSHLSCVLQTSAAAQPFVCLCGVCVCQCHSHSIRGDRVKQQQAATLFSLEGLLWNMLIVCFFLLTKHTTCSKMQLIKIRIID